MNASKINAINHAVKALASVDREFSNEEVIQLIEGYLNLLEKSGKTDGNNILVTKGDGEVFHCAICDGNVFQKMILSPKIYVCNVCDAQYDAK